MKQWRLFRAIISHNVIIVWLSLSDNGAEVEYKMARRINVRRSMNIDTQFSVLLATDFSVLHVDVLG